MRENIWAQKAEKRISEEHPDTEDESKNIGRTSGHRRQRREYLARNEKKASEKKKDVFNFSEKTGIKKERKP
jgi:hypothetical protein